MKPYNINFSHPETDYEKSMTANTYDEALDVARDSVNWPLEFKDYARMQVRISDEHGETVANYQQLN